MSHKHSLNTFTPDFTINPITREITQVFNPDEPITLMQYDHNSEKLRFECPRFVDGHDMALCNKVEVHFVNSNVVENANKSGVYRVVDLGVSESDSSKVNFSWIVSRNATENVGTLVFSVRFTCLTGDEIDYVWHTLSFTYISVDQGLVSEIDPEYQKVYLDNLETEAGKKVVEAGEAAEAALVATEMASSAINDLYSMDVTGKAPVIVSSVVGEVVAVSDSAAMPIKGLRVFGKSVQNGTPTLDNPVEIESVENPTVKIRGKNIFDFSKLGSFTKGGVTVTNNMDGSFSIVGEGELTENINVFYSYTLKEALALIHTGKISIANAPNTYPYFYVQLRYNNNQTIWTVGNNSDNVISTKDIPEEALLDDTCVLRFGFYGSSGTEIVSNTIVPIVYQHGDETWESYSEQSTTLNHMIHGIHVTSNGNYTDENGQQWICDEVDLERGVYVQRIKRTTVNISSTGTLGNGLHVGIHKASDKVNNQSIGAFCSKAKFVLASGLAKTPGCFYENMNNFALTGSANDTVDTLKAIYDGSTIQYILKTPVETPLTETEIAAYKALHSNYPNTVVMNDSGAGMEVKYAVDTKLYVDNKIKELVTALVNN